MRIAEAIDPRAPHFLERRRLLESITGQNYAFLLTHGESELSTHQAQAFTDRLERLRAGEPLAYILGTQEFYGLTFNVNRSVLIPRADTELLIDLVLPLLNTLGKANCLDLGTGSGIIPITLIHESSHCQFTATDISLEALNTAKGNAERLLKERSQLIQFCQSNWFQNIQGEFNIIISNPPYIREHDPHLLEDGLPFEPQSALTSGKSGMDALTTIIQEAPLHLKRPGYLFLEHGFDQEADVSRLMTLSGFTEIKTVKDLNNLPRVTSGILR